MLINSLVGNPHIVEMLRLVVINKAFHTFQKAILSEKLGFQLHRIEKYHSPSSSNTAILPVSSMVTNADQKDRRLCNQVRSSHLIRFRCCFSLRRWGVLGVAELVLFVRQVSSYIYWLRFSLINSISSRLPNWFLDLDFRLYKVFLSLQLCNALEHK